jgi:hypothetical protein
VDLNTKDVGTGKPPMYGPAASAHFFSEIDLEIVAPPLYVSRATLNPEAESELDELNLESMKIFLDAYAEELEAGATIFLHSLPKLATALEEAGFDPLSLDGLIASSRTKIEQATKPLPKQLQVANQRWDTVPKMFFGGSRLQLDRLVYSGADLITSQEPSWRALYYQYQVPSPIRGRAATVRVRSPASLKKIECDCPVCRENLLSKSFSQKPRTQFINLLSIHNNNVAWRQVELSKSHET